MENEEPNLVVPRPFPHEPSEVLERSTSLDVTPERVLAAKSRLQRKKHRGKLKDCNSISWLLKVYINDIFRII